MAKSKWSVYDTQIEELIQEGLTDYKISQKCLKTNETHKKNKDVDKLRTYVKRFRNRGIVKASESLEVNHENVKHLWLKDKGASLFVKNPEYKEQVEKDVNDLIEIGLKSIQNLIDKKVKLIKTSKKRPLLENFFIFDLAIITDIHVGMNPNATGFSLYGGKWDEEELNERKKIFIEQTLLNQRTNKLILFDLGDFMDGWNAETVRKGHHLPQNMDNEKAFDVGLQFKIDLITELKQFYEEIEVINICDDNHSGAFGYVVNQAFKMYIEKALNGVSVTNQRKFIDHYIFDNKCFIATHGKDGVNLKFGFKPKLDPDQVKKIENYIREHKLYNYDIYFIKGDSHQDIFDNSTSDIFNYWNFPSFAPSSNWVQTNFQKGISGFYNINFKNDPDAPYSLNPYYFKWKN